MDDDYGRRPYSTWSAKVLFLVLVVQMVVWIITSPVGGTGDPHAGGWVWVSGLGAVAAASLVTWVETRLDEWDRNRRR